MRDPTLQAAALRYAAGDLPPAESEAFEARLATDEAAQDALAEAVRLSAAALGQAAPAPSAGFRDGVRARVGRRRTSSLVSAVAGGVAVAVAAVVGLQLTPSPGPPAAAVIAVTAPPPDVFVAPEPRAVVATAAEPQPTQAEIWAELSTPDHVEKRHDDELRRRQWFRDIRLSPSPSIDARDP